MDTDYFLKKSLSLKWTILGGGVTSTAISCSQNKGEVIKPIQIIGKKKMQGQFVTWVLLIYKIGQFCYIWGLAA